MKSDMAFAVHMDGVAARYARSVDYRRKLDNERTGRKRTIRTRRTAA